MDNSDVASEIIRYGILTGQKLRPLAYRVQFFPVPVEELAARHELDRIHGMTPEDAELINDITGGRFAWPLRTASGRKGNRNFSDYSDSGRWHLVVAGYEESAR